MIRTDPDGFGIGEGVTMSTQLKTRRQRAGQLNVPPRRVNPQFTNPRQAHPGGNWLDGQYSSPRWLSLA